MVALTFPDGARREYPDNITGLDIAKGISPSLAKRTVAMALDGELADLTDPIEKDAKIEFVSREDPRALELIRHDAAHVLAEAVQTLVARHAGHHRPGDRERLLLRLLPQPAVHPGRLPGDREEDARDHRARQTVHQRDLGPREDQAGVPRQGRELQGRAGRRDPRQRADQDLSPGRLVRPVPRPAHDLDGQGRQRVQADEGRGRVLARRRQQPDAHPHLRHRVRQAGGARRVPEAARGGREARPPQARDASSTCFTSRRKAPASCSGTPRAGRCSSRSSPTCAGASKATTTR